MSGLQPPLPPPPDEKMSNKGDSCRLWVGNLDTRITEFTLLKLLQKYGTLDKFDFLYHKSGPEQGKPRGYCFVSYHTTHEASRAIQGLNGKMALSKKLIVRWAHADRAEEVGTKSADGKSPVHCPAENKSSLSKESKIRLIEAKLKMMESSSNEFKLTNGHADAGSTGCSLDRRKDSSVTTNSRTGVMKSHRTADKPYSRVTDAGSGRHSSGSTAFKR